MMWDVSFDDATASPATNYLIDTKVNLAQAKKSVSMIN